MYLINLTKPMRQVFHSTFTEQYIPVFKIIAKFTPANHTRGFDFVTQEVLFENSKKEVQN